MDEKEIAKEIGQEIIENIEFAKAISTFESGVEKGLDIASGFIRKVCDLNADEEEKE